ncbi:MAG TPA: 50S ribosomal protein L18e, partial [Candidatus Aenigmarchaeota archaeon]|nr:50S ribosomal protein L18e [Candidatus Aenigmarchaeota archaeon]
VIVVPGVVLGSGEITKPVSVAALRFSKSAEEKIKKAGGKCMSLEEFSELYPGKFKNKARIMG